MAEISLIDYLAAKLGILRMELKNPANQRQVMEELLNTPDQLFSVMDWSVAITYLLRDNYVFSSVEKAKQFIRNEFGLETNQTKQNTKMARFVQWGIPTVIGFAIFLLMQYVFMVSYVTSSSMEPTIKEGSFILATRIYEQLERGDVVVFDREGTLLVKRIVATAGETIYMDDKTGAYSLMPLETTSRTLVVPAGSFFVVGDNEENSLDSRFWDEPMVGEAQIYAVVFQ